MAPHARKLTQRERLLKGMVDATNRGGYAGANVAAVLNLAGVSRPTFYEYFSDRSECFAETIADIQARVLSAVEEAIEGAPSTPMAAMTAALVSYAAKEPARARFLMGEAMSGGGPALDVRDAGIGQIAAAVERATAALEDDELAPDIEGRVVIGSAFRMIATRLRRGEVASAKHTDELTGWLAAYERPVRNRRWHTLAPGPKPPRSPHVPDVPVQQMPSLMPPGRVRIPENEIAENHRMRILYASARLAGEKGFHASTVREITRVAGVDGSVFYRLFTNKQDAFTAVHQLGFQQVMDVTAKGFFAAEDWPARSWEGALALTQLLQANPLIAHLGFVEAYAVGAGAVQRIEDNQTAFMFFLQEGLTLSDAPLSRVTMEAVIMSVFEVIYIQARAGENLEIERMVPQIMHLWLTPFIGSAAADALIDSKHQVGRRRRL